MSREEWKLAIGFGAMVTAILGYMLLDFSSKSGY